jgi:hypothetical protein
MGYSDTTIKVTPQQMIYTTCSNTTLPSVEMQGKEKSDVAKVERALSERNKPNETMEGALKDMIGNHTPVDVVLP